MLITIILIILRTNPLLIICFKGILLLAYTIALGGVPIGSIPAHEAARHIGIPSISGEAPIATLTEHIIGLSTIT